MRKSRIPGTFSKIAIAPLNDTDAPIEVEMIHSARKPACRDCKGSENVVKYMGRWVCKVHLRVKNTRVKHGEMGDLIVLPSGVDTPFNLRPDWAFGELFVNRAHRRSMGHTSALA